MTRNDVKILNLLTIARRAGKIVLGFDATKENVSRGIAKCVVLCNDASEKTAKEIAFVCEKYNVPLIKSDIPSEEIMLKFGKKSKITGVNDKGFAKALEKYKMPE